jgi:hypothetical protein
VFFEERAQGVGLIAGGAGDQASHRVFDHHGAAQQLRDAGREVPDRSLAARALEEHPAGAVGEEQEPITPGEDGEQPPERHFRGEDE